jgi:hypothetical protein
MVAAGAWCWPSVHTPAGRSRNAAIVAAPPPRLAPSGRPILRLKPKLPALPAVEPAPTAGDTAASAAAPATRKQEKLAAARAVQATLAATWPALFARGQLRRPLAIGIHHAILAALPELDPQAVAMALKWHCNNGSYIAAILEPGAPRFDLDGNEAGEVTADQVAALRASRIKAAERQAARRAQQTNT